MRLNIIFLSFLIIIIGCVYAADDYNDDQHDDSSSSPLNGDEKPVERPKYVRPVVKDFHFLDPFDEFSSIGKKWIKSIAKKEGVDDADLAKYDGLWEIEEALESVIDNDFGLVLKSKARHHAISAPMVKPFQFNKNKPLVVQYEVKFQTPLECGGAYVKLLEDKKGDMDNILKQFHDKTSFSIMFGPDKCGTDSKYHFIIRFKHPKTGQFEEKHAKKSTSIPDNIFSDGKSHLYTLIVRPDNTFKMLIDDLEVNAGSLLTDMTPSIVPDKIISDPNDVKPETWDDRERIQDPDAVKPEDWDEDEPKTIPDADAFMPEGWLESEPETIADPVAIMPEDWDADTDGEWEAPRIENPECKNAPGCGKWEAPQKPNPNFKGKWKAPFIDNVNYQGKWEARKIDNPDYFELTDAFSSLTPFSAVGLELWSMTENILFDNFIITDSEEIAHELAKDTWAVKKGLESAKSGSGDNVFTGLQNAANDKPWLWAVYLLVVIIPIVLIVVFCCKSSDDSGDRKKTDDPTPDDKIIEEEGEGEGEEEAAVEEPEEEEEEEKVTTKNDLEEEAEAIETTTKATKKSPTKRRPRKE